MRWKVNRRGKKVRGEVGKGGVGTVGEVGEIRARQGKVGKQGEVGQGQGESTGLVKVECEYGRTGQDE